MFLHIIGHYFQVIKSSIPYGVLSMVAEIGGYVGLFLGISIQQLAGVPYYAARRIANDI
jgi:hypothetical protein